MAQVYAPKPSPHAHSAHLALNKMLHGRDDDVADDDAQPPPAAAPAVAPAAAAAGAAAAAQPADAPRPRARRPRLSLQQLQRKPPPPPTNPPPLRLEHLPLQLQQQPESLLQDTQLGSPVTGISPEQSRCPSVAASFHTAKSVASDREQDDTATGGAGPPATAKAPDQPLPSRPRPAPISIPFESITGPLFSSYPISAAANAYPHRRRQNSSSSGSHYPAAADMPGRGRRTSATHDHDATTATGLARCCDPPHTCASESSRASSAWPRHGGGGSGSGGGGGAVRDDASSGSGASGTSTSRMSRTTVSNTITPSSRAGSVLSLSRRYSTSALSSTSITTTIRNKASKAKEHSRNRRRASLSSGECDVARWREMGTAAQQEHSAPFGYTPESSYMLRSVSVVSGVRPLKSPVIPTFPPEGPFPPPRTSSLQATQESVLLGLARLSFHNANGHAHHHHGDSVAVKDGDTDGNDDQQELMYDDDGMGDKLDRPISAGSLVEPVSTDGASFVSDPSTFSPSNMSKSLPSTKTSLSRSARSGKEGDQSALEDIEAHMSSKCRATSTTRALVEKRRHILLEIVETEVTYVQDLRALVHIYLPQLAALPHIQERIHQLVVRNTTDLLDFHQQFAGHMVDILRYAGMGYASADSQTIDRVTKRLAELFVREITSFRLYNDYCADSTIAAAFLRDITNRADYEAFEKRCQFISSGAPHATLRDILANQASAPVRSRLQFKDILITPVQRVCRYPLLLASLLADVKSDQPPSDVVAAVEAAQYSMRSVAEKADEARRRKEAQLKTATVADRIEPHPALTRRLVRRLGTCRLIGALDVLHHHPTLAPLDPPAKVKYLAAFLYRGYLILAKVKRGRTFEAKHYFPLEVFEFDVITEGYVPHSIRLSFKEHAFYLAASCEAEKELWSAELCSARDESTMPPFELPSSVPLFGGPRSRHSSIIAARESSPQVAHSRPELPPLSHLLSPSSAATGLGGTSGSVDDSSIGSNSSKGLKLMDLDPINTSPAAINKRHTLLGMEIVSSPIDSPSLTGPGGGGDSPTASHGAQFPSLGECSSTESSFSPPSMPRQLSDSVSRGHHRSHSHNQPRALTRSQSQSTILLRQPAMNARLAVDRALADVVYETLATARTKVQLHQIQMAQATGSGFSATIRRARSKSVLSENRSTFADKRASMVDMVRSSVVELVTPTTGPEVRVTGLPNGSPSAPPRSTGRPGRLAIGEGGMSISVDGTPVCIAGDMSRNTSLSSLAESSSATPLRTRNSSTSLRRGPDLSLTPGRAERLSRHKNSSTTNVGMYPPSLSRARSMPSSPVMEPRRRKLPRSSGGGPGGRDTDMLEKMMTDDDEDYVMVPDIPEANSPTIALFGQAAMANGTPPTRPSAAPGAALKRSISFFSRRSASSASTTAPASASTSELHDDEGGYHSTPSRSRRPSREGATTPGALSVASDIGSHGHSSNNNSFISLSKAASTGSPPMVKRRRSMRLFGPLRGFTTMTTASS